MPMKLDEEVDKPGAFWHSLYIPERVCSIIVSVSKRLKSKKVFDYTRSLDPKKRTQGLALPLEENRSP